MSPTPTQTEADAFWYMNLTPEQERTHDKFLQHLKETNALYAGQDDRWTLLRFLKARQWDIQRAAVMYNTMTKWRREHGTDQLPASFHFQEEDAVVAVSLHTVRGAQSIGLPHVARAEDPSGAALRGGRLRLCGSLLGCPPLTEVVSGAHVHALLFSAAPGTPVRPTRPMQPI